MCGAWRRARKKTHLAVGRDARLSGARTKKTWKTMHSENKPMNEPSSYFNDIISQCDQNYIKTNMRAPSRINDLHVDGVCKVFCMTRWPQTPIKRINTSWTKRTRPTFWVLFFLLYTPLTGGMSKYYFDMWGMSKKYFDTGGMSKKYFDMGVCQRCITHEIEKKQCKI